MVAAGIYTYMYVYGLGYVCLCVCKHLREEQVGFFGGVWCLVSVCRLAGNMSLRGDACICYGRIKGGVLDDVGDVLGRFRVCLFSGIWGVECVG